MRNVTSLDLRALSDLPFVRSLRADGEVATVGFPDREVRYRLHRVLAPRAGIVEDLAQPPPDADAWLVRADRVGPGAAVALRDAGIGFVDRAGNLFLNEADRYVAWVEGRRHRAPPRPTGLRGASYRVLFAALAQPFVLDGPPWEFFDDYPALEGRSLPDHTLRYVAAVAGTSTTAVTNLWNHLRRTGALLRTEAGVVLADPAAVTETWWVGYRDVLRPRLTLGRVRLPGGGAAALARTLDASARPGRWGWGGQTAAGVLLRDPDAPTRGPKWTVHVHDIDTVDELRLEPEPDGPVLVLGTPGPLALPGRVHGHPCAHPLLVWSELRVAGDPRSQEIADSIAESWRWTWSPRG